MLHSRLPDRLLYPLVGLLAVAYFFVYHRPLLASPLHFNDDVVQHLVWLYGTDWADDFYARTSAAIQPRGYYVVAWLLGRLGGPLWVSAYGPLLTTILTAGLAVAVFKKYLPLAVALAGAYLTLQYTIDTGLGFLARGFTTPLLLGMMWALPRRGGALAVASLLLLSALFYPPALLINGLILVCWELGRLIVLRRSITLSAVRRRYAVLLAGGLLAVGTVLLHQYTITHSPDLGSIFTLEELRARPEFTAAGRVPFTNLIHTPFSFMGAYFVRYELGQWPVRDWAFYLLAFSVVVGLLSYRKLGRYTAYLGCFAIATGVLYEIARGSIPTFFFPDRYLSYPWRLGAALVIVLAAGGALHLSNRRTLQPPDGRRLGNWSTGIAVAVLLAVGLHVNRPGELPYVDIDHLAPLLTYLNTLPEDAMIAAPPTLASAIPLVSRRAVLIGHEQAHALYFRNYYDYVTPRYRDYVEAITAPGDSLSILTGFMDTYGVDYLVIDPDLPTSWSYGMFPPHTDRFLARSRVQTNSNTDRAVVTPDLAVLRIPESAGVRVEGYLVVSRDSL